MRVERSDWVYQPSVFQGVTSPGASTLRRPLFSPFLGVVAQPRVGVPFILATAKKQSPVSQRQENKKRTDTGGAATAWGKGGLSAVAVCRCAGEIYRRACALG